MEANIETPNNCLECKYAEKCSSYYASTTCKYKNEINKKVIEKLLLKNNK